MLPATPDAPTTLEELKELLKHDTKVKVAIIDVDGVLRGKIMSKDKFLSAAKSGFGFCGVVFGWDSEHLVTKRAELVHDSTYFKELLVSNKGNGYRDLLAEIDLETYRRLPWEQNVPLFLCRLSMPDGSPLMPDPRTLLRSILVKAEEQGYQAMSGAEFEYFQFSETPKTIAQKGFTKLDALTPGMHGYSMLRPQLNVDYFHDLYDQATAMGIEVEGHHTETGPGVFESALGYTDCARMADNAVLFKLVAKSVGMTHNIMPTFMAKPYSDMPGCSGHIHVSLRDGNGRNIFAAQTPREEDSDLKYFSQEAEWFLGGLLEGLPDIIPMMCPNINSYKRLLGGEAMWAPDTASYGYESRAASVRLIGPPLAPSGAARFEVRIPGADMNTHYAMSAIFALGLRGIAKQIAVTAAPYGKPGSTYAELTKLPTSLEAATNAFKAEGSIAREVFGDFFVDHFAGTREHELEVHRRAVTSWEVERYFELA